MTYGTITQDKEKNEWIIECEPHVSMRLKRVFGKLGTNSFGKHRISINDDNSRDLLWFMERYPLSIDPNLHVILKMYSDQSKQTETFIEHFYNSGYEPSDAPLIHPAREYQKEAVALFHRMKGLLLADDVGLGKSVSFIASLKRYETLPAVIVALAHLPKQWEDMIKYFAPHLRTHIIKSKTIYKIKPTDVYIISYHKLSAWAETLSKITKAVCFDECQELRRNSSDKYAASKHLADNTNYRIGLSATPIYNYGGEFFNVIDVLSPGKLGTKEEFEREWCNVQYSKSSLRDPKAFGTYLRTNGMMLRRTRHEVNREIPPVTKIYQYTEADTEALEDVHSSCRELAKIILSDTKRERGEQMKASEEFSNKLRQATGIAKAPYVAAFTRLLIENGEKVVLYGWHRMVYDIWKRSLWTLNPLFYTGSESAKQKEESKQAFINGESNLLILSLRSGAGLDGLQHVCKTVVKGELDYSPGVHEQCIGRVARDGQADPVMCYYMISEEGSDPLIADILGVKKNQIDAVRNIDEPLIEKLEVDPNHVKRLAESYLAKYNRRK